MTSVSFTRSPLSSFILTLVFSGLVYSQALNYKVVSDLMNDFSKSAVFIQTPQRYGTGTLFVVPFADTGTAGRPYVVTAKHVLDRTDSLNRIIGSFDTVSIFLNRLGGNKEARLYRTLYASNTLDIAVLDPIQYLRPFSQYDTFVPNLTDIASYSDIRKSELAFIAGFPFGIGTQHGRLDPVIQSGIVSHIDSALSRVLIDIPVNPGNSGCPVYILTLEGVPKLLGLVFQYEPSTEDVVIRLATRSPAPANASLGRVVLLTRIITELRALPH